MGSDTSKHPLDTLLYNMPRKGAHGWTLEDVCSRLRYPAPYVPQEYTTLVDGQRYISLDGLLYVVMLSTHYVAVNYRRDAFDPNKDRALAFYQHSFASEQDLQEQEDGQFRRALRSAFYRAKVDHRDYSDEQTEALVRTDTADTAESIAKARVRRLDAARSLDLPWPKVRHLPDLVFELSILAEADPPRTRLAPQPIVALTETPAQALTQDQPKAGTRRAQAPLGDDDVF
jgi:hypothetical protein